MSWLGYRQERVTPTDLVLRRDNNTDRLEVMHAEPKIRVAAELLEDLRAGGGHRDVTLDGDVLTINATNQRVIYRIGQYDPLRDCYSAEWPD